MNILHITTVDVGGAYKAAERISESLKEEGVNSNILFRNKTKDCTDGIAFLESLPQIMVSKTKNFINLLLSREQNVIREIWGSDISKHPSVSKADIIFLHWINSFISPKALQKLFELNKPIVWVLHDMWPVTGGCHYDFYCGRFDESCGMCPLLTKQHERDITRKNFEDKLKVYKNNSFYVVGPSRWSVDVAKKSFLLRNKSVYYIPNCINMNVYYPRNKREMRIKLQLPLEKKIVLFGADNEGTENKIKGFSYLLEALKFLENDNLFLLIFGRAESKTLQKIHQDYKTVGYIEDENTMAEIYSAADVMVTPSLQEAFGFTVCEAMACGTAVAAFGVGGILDQVEHEKSGYLAELYDSKDLAEGIRFCANNSEELGKAARIAAQQFSYKNVGRQYIELIEKLYKESNDRVRNNN